MNGQELTNTPRQIFARNLRKRRVAEGLSQESLAAFSGLHRTYIGSVERGERNISIDNMARIATALNCTIQDLLVDRPDYDETSS